MKKLELYRNTEFTDSIGGTLLFDDSIFSTLELPWLHNSRNASCIPTGTYKLRITRNRKTTGGMLIPITFEILDVLDRGGILFHVGNFSKDTQGCILIGTKCMPIGQNRGMVKQSRLAWDSFASLIDGKEDYSLEIY